MNPQRRHRLVVLLAAVVLLGAGCSQHAAVAPTPAPATAPATEHASTASHAPAAPESSAPEAPRRQRGVVCLPVVDAVARDIAAGSVDALVPVPGTSVAYRPRGLHGTYLVVMAVTRPGRSEPQLGVWAVARSIRAVDHGPITSVDVVARRITSWPVARVVGPDDVRVSEARACTLR